MKMQDNVTLLSERGKKTIRGILMMINQIKKFFTGKPGSKTEPGQSMLQDITDNSKADDESIAAFGSRGGVKPEFIKEVMQIPQCIFPWVFLGLGWGKYGVCCNSYNMDFGNITEVGHISDFSKDIFNSDSYIRMRKSLAEGCLNENCRICPQRMYGGGGIHQVVNQYTNVLLQVKDHGQRHRAWDNFAMGVEAAVFGKAEVEHTPSFLNICCGSACNIRCKFCYNCRMEYDPEPKDILKVIERVHENLIFVQLTGGEPLVTRAGREILKEFATGKYKFAVRLGTNAQWTDFDLLKPVNLAEVQISSDGATKEVYERVRVGGDFDDLIKNIKGFMEFKKMKPDMVIRLNYTVTSDNYMDIPEAVKLYEDLGLFVTFNLVMRQKDDPQNIKERPELYEDLLKYVDRGMEQSQYIFTQDCLKNIREMVYEKMQHTDEENK